MSGRIIGLLLLIVCWGNNILAQTDFRPQMVEQAVIYREARQALIIPNPSGGRMQVSCTGCSYIRQDTTNKTVYYLYPDVRDTITIHLTQGTKKTDYGFRLRTLPPRVVRLDHYDNHANVSRQQVEGFIRMVYPPEIQRLNISRCSVLSWELESNGSTIAGTGNQLTNEALNQIRNSVYGRAFTIMVKYRCPETCQRVAVFQFTVK